MEVRLLEEENKIRFKCCMKDAFQDGFETTDGIRNYLMFGEVLDDIFKGDNTFAYEMIDDNNEIIGGAIVTVDSKSNFNNLDFIFIRPDKQGQGYGSSLWNKIEDMYPDTIFWEGVISYFDKRNIYFYVNKLDFDIVEYFNSLHHIVDNTSLEGMFRVRKDMRK